MTNIFFRITSRPSNLSSRIKNVISALESLREIHANQHLELNMSCSMLPELDPVTKKVINPCGTSACHAGWMTVALARIAKEEDFVNLNGEVDPIYITRNEQEVKLTTFKEQLNEYYKRQTSVGQLEDAQLNYWFGADMLHRYLGFNTFRELKLYLNENPQIWGDTSTDDMFSAHDFWNKDWFIAECEERKIDTSNPGLDILIHWWTRVRHRLEVCESLHEHTTGWLGQLSKNNDRLNKIVPLLNKVYDLRYSGASDNVEQSYNIEVQLDDLAREAISMNIKLIDDFVYPKPKQDIIDSTEDEDTTPE